MTVEMKSREPALNSGEIDAIQAKLGVEFPADYRGFLLKHNVVKPEANVFTSPNTTTSVSLFYGKSRSATADLLAVADIYSGRLPDGVFPIAEASGGNLICIQEKTGAVFFWDHENEAVGEDVAGYDNMDLLAASFSGFENALRPYGNAEAAADTQDMKVTSVTVKKGFTEKFQDFMK